MKRELDNLVRRLEAVERQNRRLKLGGACAGLALGALGLLSAAGPLCEVVSAERLVVRDARGKARMTLDAYHTEPHLTLNDKQGKPVARFGVGEDGRAYLVTLDEKGKPRANLFAPAAAGDEARKSKVDDDPTVASR